MELSKCLGTYLCIKKFCLDCYSINIDAAELDNDIDDIGLILKIEINNKSNEYKASMIAYAVM